MQVDIYKFLVIYNSQHAQDPNIVTITIYHFRDASCNNIIRQFEPKHLVKITRNLICTPQIVAKLKFYVEYYCSY